MAPQRCDPTLQQDVNYLVLDVLMYGATTALLRLRKKDRNIAAAAATALMDVENRLKMVDSFLAICERDHKGSSAPSALQFRLKLLKFSALYILRHNRRFPLVSVFDLDSLRKSNRRRVRNWWKRLGRVIDTGQTKDRQYKHISQNQEYPTFLDLLPGLVDLIATTASLAAVPVDKRLTSPSKNNRKGNSSRKRNFSQVEDRLSQEAESDGEITVATLEFLAETMLQAVLEQYTSCHAQGTWPIVEAFSWGPGSSPAESAHSVLYVGEPPFSSPSDEDEDDEALPCSKAESKRLNSIFHLTCDDQIDANMSLDDRKSETNIDNPNHARTWRNIRQKHLDMLRTLHLNNDGDQNEKLKAIQASFPLADFELKLMSFLSLLHKWQPKPLLVQLEQGGDVVVGGMELTNEQTAHLRRLARMM